MDNVQDKTSSCIKTSFSRRFNVSLLSAQQRRKRCLPAMLPRAASTHVLAQIPTGQNCLSICFTYCTLILYSSYLTLISSYQSQPLAVKVPRQPQVPLPNGDSLMQQRKECSRGCAVMKVNYKSGEKELWLQLCSDGNVRRCWPANSMGTGAADSLWQRSSRKQVSVRLWLQLHVISKAGVSLEGIMGVRVQETRRSPHCLHTYRHRTFSVALD